MATKLKTYSIWAHCHRDVSIEIEAESLESALEKSKTLTDSDFVEVLGEYNDGSTEIYGVFKQ